MGKRKRQARASKSSDERGAPGGERVHAREASPPPRERLHEGRTIRIGDVEPLPDGRQLRCIVRGNRAVVAVFDRERPCEPTLSCAAPRARLVAGHAFDEGEFSQVLDSYTIHSPWHDGEYTCLVRTIDCLRRGTEHELVTFKDL